MKTYTILFLVILPLALFSQPSTAAYFGRLNPTVNKATLNEARLISEIEPGLWSRLELTSNNRGRLEQRRKLFGYYIYREQANYNTIVDYVSVEISAIVNGKVLTAQAPNDKLSNAQQNILQAADLNTDISIKIKFRYKYDTSFENEIMEGLLNVMVVPDIEAEYSGGIEAILKHLTQYVTDRSKDKKAVEKLGQSAVTFVVDEDGAINKVKIVRSSNDARIDDLLIEAVEKMHKWKPAKNSKNLNVKQELRITFGGGC